MTVRMFILYTSVQGVVAKAGDTLRYCHTCCEEAHKVLEVEHRIFPMVNIGWLDGGV